MHTTQKSIKLKTGEILPKGLPVSFNSENHSTCLVQGERAEPYRVRITSAFEAPSIEELGDAVNDGVCESVLGETVEPDGIDCYNSPSWLLALGMI